MDDFPDHNPVENRFPDIGLFPFLIFLKCRECCHPLVALKKNISIFLNFAVKIDHHWLKRSNFNGIDQRES